MLSLRALQPEAEPPLPADHEALRSRTPPHGEGAQGMATRVERIMTPERAPRIDTPARLDPLERDPLSRVAPSPLLGVKAFDPPPDYATANPSVESSVPAEVPQLTDGKRYRGLLVVLLLLAVGATVGWLLSRDPPPTADEIRASGAQQHPQ